jgi:hypothetical protein
MRLIYVFAWRNVRCCRAGQLAVGVCNLLQTMLDSR